MFKLFALYFNFFHIYIARNDICATRTRASLASAIPVCLLFHSMQFEPNYSVDRRAVVGCYSSSLN